MSKTGKINTLGAAYRIQTLWGTDPRITEKNNISHVDGATPEQSNSGIQKTYSIIGRNFMKVTENKLLLEKFEMLRAKL